MLVTSVAPLLALAGCSGDAPSGQVIATVDGSEITLAELNEEARTRNLDVAADRALRDVLLRELIERRLLVAEARRRKLDRTPEHILARRRWEEIALGQQLLQAAAREKGQVPEAELARFASEHPQWFADRAMITADVAAVPATIPQPLRQALGQATSREAMERLLVQGNVQARWTRQEWDSAAPPSGLEQLPGSGPFAVEQDGQLVIGTVVARRPTPVPPEQRLQLARAMIERQRAEEAMTRILQQARSKADISLQPTSAERP
ncbi:hypothetical protein [Sphingomonas sp. LHG3406-1]|uniref:hypothetical protein n=1 Tax=Sphingomonas sp. LHG3406-1 TaxID=2804617 RepID=UPI00261E9330|nr:hypothetical protein [Sphingomonas sp. LHG3406-1]